MITNIEQESSGMTLSVEVTPSVDFHKLEEVIVLLSKPQVLTSNNPAQATDAKAQGVK